MAMDTVVAHPSKLIKIIDVVQVQAQNNPVLPVPGGAYIYSIRRLLRSGFNLQITIKIKVEISLLLHIN
jgi:hypothetical protein